MNSDRLMELVNRHRDALQRETENCCDAATVAQYLVLTFALDHTDHVLDERVRAYLIDMARESYAAAELSGFRMVRPQ